MMMPPGAQGRLLPASVPMRFFGLAVAAHAGFWAVLFVVADELAGFRGGFAPLLAAVHLLTIGVLAATVIGAAVQIVPVVMRRPIALVWPIRLVFWLLLIGLALLAAGFCAVRPELTVAGGGAAALALALFVGVLADALRRSTGPPLVVAYAWAGLIALLVTALLGLRLAVDLLGGSGADHAAFALGHWIIGGFGCMGLLMLGFSHVLVPMFAIASPPARRPAWIGFAAAVVAVLLGAVGALGRRPDLLVAGAGIGFVASVLHVRLMWLVVKRAMRRRLGLSFVLIRSAWLLQPALIAVATYCAAGGRAANAPIALAILLFGGWLLTFLLGVLQQILPTLASMHVAAGDRVAGSLAGQGEHRWPLRVHALCHALALAGVIVGAMGDTVGVVRLGCALGVIGAVAFATFAVRVLRIALFGRPAGSPASRATPA